ncbi:hypothetical protein HMPREF1052_2225 [Pasteurella bettyae CCUG 2042]|uniref:Enoyl-CoA hydratase n=1 Tax=Pasteurella bettyae CCUG 2042 TaxID=1095749 RepID=I3DC15_9PAST|nr:hypothetical protein [Pasteurella bettyae]EIJ69258.1 hypothetical protein HMPREF1052_2225 [Pasteurella bettyae CCUG 2042]
MANQLFLAFYKGSGGSLWDKLIDLIIRKTTRGKYSHCELVIAKTEFITGTHYEYETTYHCYTSSPRDGGVRCKVIDSRTGDWDLLPINSSLEQQILTYYAQTKGARYDYCGALGVILGIKQKRSKYFCSEWCFNAITGRTDGWRFSPNQLAVIFKGIYHDKFTGACYV